jgi:hypothetical protein
MVLVRRWNIIGGIKGLCPWFPAPELRDRESRDTELIGQQ